MTGTTETEPRTAAEPGPEPQAAPRPKVPPPPLLGRSPSPRAARIRKPVVQAMGGAAALLLAGSLAWAFVVQPELRAAALERKGERALDDHGGAVRPADGVVEQPATYDRLPADQLPPPRIGEREPAPGAPTPLAAPAPVQSGARSGASASGPSERAQAAASGLFFPSAPRQAPATNDVSEGRSGGPALPATYSPHGLTPPVSPWELKAGAVLPAVLLTAVDTSRRGPVLATVSQNVFDSVTGRYLLIPQGARLIGRHEGESAWGDRRAFIVWERLILPNGKSLVLLEEPGVDARGSIGVPGRADRRLFDLGVAALISGAITTVGEFARGGSRESDGRSLLGTAGDAAAIEAAQVGGRLIDRELQVRPVIRVDPGASIRVMITRDLILEPYAR